jgi:mycothiol synthase
VNRVSDQTVPPTLAERIGPLPDLVPPQHPDIAVWRPPTVDDIDAIHSVLAAADRVDHPTWVTPRADVADTFDFSHIDHSRDSLLGFTAGGDPVVVVTASRHPSTDTVVQSMLSGAVHPQWRRRGIGAAAARWLYARGLQQLAESGSTVPGELRIYAAESDHGNVAIAESLGLRTERWFASMVRDMTEPVPDVAAPEGIEVVRYSPDRASDAMDARNDAFRDHWGSLPQDPERWEKFVGGEFFRPDLSTLALDGGRIVAMCLASVNEDDWETLGASNSYIDLIGVVRSHRRRGLAPLVIAATLAAIRDAGLQKAVLDVDTESPTGANTLYERLGFSPIERERVLTRRF